MNFNESLKNETDKQSTEGRLTH